MKKLFLLLLLFPAEAFAQQNNDNGEKYDFDAFFSPDFYTPSVKEYPGFKYLSVFSYSIGANIVWHVTEKPNLSIRSGIRYSIYNQKSENTDPSYFVFFEKIDFIEIPLAFRHYFFRKKLSVYGDMMASFNLGNKDYYLNPHLTWGLAIGLEYALNTDFSVFVQPTFRKPFEKNDVYAYSKSIEMGLKYNLTKH